MTSEPKSGAWEGKGMERVAGSRWGAQATAYAWVYAQRQTWGRAGAEAVEGQLQTTTQGRIY